LTTLPHERLLVLAVVFTMALGLSLTLAPSILPWYGAALAVLACAAVPYLLHAHPGYSFSPLRLILPAGVAIASPSVAHALGNGPFRLPGVFGPGALLYGVVLAEYLLLGQGRDTSIRAARLLLTVTACGVALAVFLLIYEAKERSLISGNLVAAISGALALRVVALDAGAGPKTYWSGVIAAVAMAEVLWPLNYWVLGSVAGGLALFVTFYVLVGVMRQSVAGQLGQTELLEYGTVSLAGLLMVFVASRL